MTGTEGKVVLNGREFQLVDTDKLRKVLEAKLNRKVCPFGTFNVTAVDPDSSTTKLQLRLWPAQGSIDNASLEGRIIKFTFRMVAVQNQSRTIFGTWDITTGSAKIKFRG
jgi:hypothetical protein